MIVISNALLLSPTVSLKHSRILYDTYTRSLQPSAVTVSTDSDSTPGDAPLRPDTFEYWQPTEMPATWRVDLGEPKDVDAVGIAGHTIGSSGASVLVEYSDNEADWTTFAQESSPSNDAPILFLDQEVFARYWRITLTGDTEPQIAVVYIGIALAMQRGLFGGHSPINLSRSTVLKNSMSRGGRFLGQNFKRNGVSSSASFSNLTGDWYRQYFDPFVRSARKYPYFFAWRPQSRPSEVAYVWSDKDIAPTNQGGRDMVDVSFEMQGVGYSE